MNIYLARGLMLGVKRDGMGTNPDRELTQPRIGDGEEPNPVDL